MSITSELYETLIDALPFVEDPASCLPGTAQAFGLQIRALLEKIEANKKEMQIIEAAPIMLKALQSIPYLTCTHEGHRLNVCWPCLVSHAIKKACG